MFTKRRTDSKHLTCINSFNPDNNPQEQVTLLLSRVSQWRNWGPQTVSDFPRVTELGSQGTLAQAFWLQGLDCPTAERFLPGLARVCRAVCVQCCQVQPSPLQDCTHVHSLEWWRSNWLTPILQIAGEAGSWAAFCALELVSITGSREQAHVNTGASKGTETRMALHCKVRT